ncbi:MAG: hypothetical protein FJZ92_07280 [Chloroflexi bacterium]|nr:hypothetical protein [Chloroflexota bacterium]
MALAYLTWEARDAKHAFADIGWGALAVCREARAVDGVADARSWGQTVGRVAILIETAPDVAPSLVSANAEVVKATPALNKVARNVDYQTWADPRVAAKNMEASGVA